MADNVTPFRKLKSSDSGMASSGQVLNRLVGSREAVVRQMQEIASRDDYLVPPMPVVQVKQWICEICHFTCDDNGNHGWFKDIQGKAVPCSACTPLSNRGIYRRKAAKLIQQLVQDCKLLNAQNLPEDAGGLTLDRYPKQGDKKALAIVKRFVSGGFKELFLTSDVGRGKSGLAIAAAHEMTKQGEQVLYMPMKLYIELVQENFNKDEAGRQVPNNHIKDVCKLVDVLIIDDLGTERVTDSGFVVEETQELVEARHAAGLRTLITTNYTLEGLASYWYMPRYERMGFQPGARLVSRIGGWYEKHTFSGPDLRLI